jgi:hypothetical protein
MNRMQQETPKFFKKLRDAGIILAAISATLLTTPGGLTAHSYQNCRLPGSSR